MTKINKVVTIIMLVALIVLSYIYNAPDFGAVVAVGLIIVPCMETVKKEDKEVKNTYKPRI